MKKFKLLFGAIALAAVTLVSCSKDDDNNSNDNAIIGKWTFIKEEALDVNNKVVSEYSSEYDERCNKSYAEFKNNGDLVSTYYEYYNNQCNQFSEAGKWILTDNILVVTHKKSEGEGEDIVEYTATFEGDSMYLIAPLSREEAQYYDLNVVKLRNIYKKL